MQGCHVKSTAQCTLIHVALLPHSPCHDNVVNLQDHTHAFSSESESTGRHESWLEHFCFIHILNGVLLDVKASVFVACCVTIAQFGNKDDWVESSVLTESVWNKLKGFSICSADIGV